MSKVLDWIKSNLVIVILVVVMVVVVAAATIFSRSMNEAVRTEASSRASKLSQLNSLEKTTVTVAVPGQVPISETTIVNPQLLERYREFGTALSADAEAVAGAAVRHNRKDRGVLLPRLFPIMPRAERDTIPAEYYEIVLNAYDGLLKSVRAGSPPSSEEVLETLLTRESQFITNNFRKESRSELNEGERKDLDRDLSRARLAAYGEAAQEIGMYATAASLDRPVYPQGRLPNMTEMFDWQWKYWIQQDILRALARANGPDASVVAAPVKQVLGIRVIDDLQGPSAQPGAGGGGGGGGGGLSGGFGGRRGFGGGNTGGASAPAVDDADDLAAQQIRIDTAKEAARNYAVSPTGRSSNHLYDVRNVRLDLVTSSADLPAVLDAISSENFMTIVSLEVEPADPFLAAARGYIFGTSPVVRVGMVIETVWLREWTGQFMPGAVRKSLGITTAPAVTG